MQRLSNHHTADSEARQRRSSGWTGQARAACRTRPPAATTTGPERVSSLLLSFVEGGKIAGAGRDIDVLHQSGLPRSCTFGLPLYVRLIASLVLGECHESRRARWPSA